MNTTPLSTIFEGDVTLGIGSDKSIIEMCLLDMEKYSYYIDLF